jgi:hypothetical protein
VGGRAVLMEKTTPERVDQMLEAVDEFTAARGSNILLFTDEAALARSNPLDLEWVSGKREAYVSRSRQSRSLVNMCFQS